MALWLLLGCVGENCGRLNCENLNYPIEVYSLDGPRTGDTVSADSFRVAITLGSEQEAALAKKSVTSAADCPNCYEGTTLTHLTFSVDVVVPGGDTVKAGANHLAEPRKSGSGYRLDFTRSHAFLGNNVRVSHRLVLQDSVVKTAFKDFVIRP